MDESLPASGQKRVVALKYEAHKDAAPRVVAKGQGWVAERILQQAKGAEVPVVNDQCLVALLYPLALEQNIPQELFPVVAEVFAFIYRLEKGNGQEENG